MTPSSKSDAPARLAGIQGLRGVAVVLVALVHLSHTETKYTHGPVLFGDWSSFGICGVDIFLAVSGFVLTYLAFGHFANTRYVRAYAYARVTRVYPMYVLLTLPLVPVFLAAPTLFNAAEGHEVNLLRSLLLLPDVRLPLIPVAWTLHHELYFYLVFGCMLLLPETRLRWAMLAWLAVCVALIAYGANTPRQQQGAFERVLVNPINLEFLLGMLAALCVAQGWRRYGTLCCWLAIAWLIVAVALWVRLTGNYWVGDFWRVWVYGVPATLFMYGIVVRETGQGRVFARAITWIGDGAYSIYLSHLMVLVVVGRAWKELGGDGWIAHLLFLSGSLAIALWVGFELYRRIEKPLLALARRHAPGTVPQATRTAGPRSLEPRGK